MRVYARPRSGRVAPQDQHRQTFALVKRFLPVTVAARTVVSLAYAYANVGKPNVGAYSANTRGLLVWIGGH